MSFNPIYLTAYGARPQTKDEILALWNDGKDFKVYAGTLCSVRDALRMRMAGFTHVQFVWQNDLTREVHGYLLDLRDYKPPANQPQYVPLDPFKD